MRAANLDHGGHGELLAMMLLSWANIAYYQSLMDGIRESIAGGCFEEFRAATKEQWKRGEHFA